MLTQISQLSFSIAQWGAWCQQLPTAADWQHWALEDTSVATVYGEKGTPSISFLPIGMRKKLSDNTKVCLFLCHTYLTEAQRRGARIVYASRHGESGTTMELIESLAAGEASSPMGFSRSVHNSAVGLFSIYAGNKNANTAISAGTLSFEAGLLESLLQLYSTDAEEVVYVFAEEAIPASLTPWVNDPPVPYGMLFVLRKGSEQIDESLGEHTALGFLRWAILTYPNLHTNYAEDSKSAQQ